MRFLQSFLFFLIFAIAQATTYYKDTFEDGNAWTSRWIQSSAKSNEGSSSFKLSSGAFYGDKSADQGLQTSQDNKHYFYTSKLAKEFDNSNKDLVLQYSVKHEQRIDCGGGYIKLLPSDVDQQNFNGESPYNIMFGPDICGSTRKVHVILNYKGENKLIKKEIPAETDEFTHVYTLILRPDQTYEVRIDGVSKQTGSLLDDWDFLPPRKIKDPNVSKPADWVDEAMIDDPSDSKPADWDSQPSKIPDPEALKPDDWDDEADGEWEAPMIDNPDFKGEWKPKRIPNPAYKGKWVHPEIDNPDFEEDNSIYAFKTGAVGFDLWQVKSGTIFDNILLTDDVSEAETLLANTFTKSKDAERKMKEAQDAAKREAESAAADSSDDSDSDKDEL